MSLEATTGTFTLCTLRTFYLQQAALVTRMARGGQMRTGYANQYGSSHWSFVDIVLCCRKRTAER